MIYQEYFENSLYSMLLPRESCVTMKKLAEQLVVCALLCQLIGSKSPSGLVRVLLVNLVDIQIDYTISAIPNYAFPISTEFCCMYLRSNTFYFIFVIKWAIGDEAKGASTRTKTKSMKTKSATIKRART
jgi:hypothetical protein